MMQDQSSSRAMYRNYIGDFFSDPDRQVHSIVSEEDTVIFVRYSFAEQFSLTPKGGKTLITDQWLHEIMEYLSMKGYSIDQMHLRRV